MSRSRAGCQDARGDDAELSRTWIDSRRQVLLITHHIFRGRLPHPTGSPGGWARAPGRIVVRLDLTAPRSHAPNVGNRCVSANWPGDVRRLLNSKRRDRLACDRLSQGDHAIKRRVTPALCSGQVTICHCRRRVWRRPPRSDPKRVWTTAGIDADRRNRRSTTASPRSGGHHFGGHARCVDRCPRPPIAPIRRFLVIPDAPRMRVDQSSR